MLVDGINVNGSSVNWDGVLWQRHWVADGEGPYTRLGKLALANAEGEDFLSRLVLGARPCTSAATGEFHPRTLLSAHWMRRTQSAAHTISEEIRASTLESVLGPWWKWLATDERLRFCPLCLRHGFHSSLTQIVAIARCPFHRCPLCDKCMHCGRPAPRYAADRGFEHPLRCGECSQLLAGPGFDIGSPHSWTALEAASHSHHALQQKLSRIRTQRVDWSDVADWRASSIVDAAGQKRAVFRALSTVLGIGGFDDIVSPAPAFSIQPLSRESGAISREGRTAVVKAIRRHLLSPAVVKELKSNFSRGDLFVDWTQRQVIARGCTAHAHAACTWLLRFGAWPFDSEFNLDPLARLAVPLEILEWPLRVRITDQAWASFARHCFYADLASASIWRQRVNTRSGRAKRAVWMQLSNSMRSQLSTRRRIPPGVAVITRRDDADELSTIWLLGDSESPPTTEVRTR